MTGGLPLAPPPRKHKREPMARKPRTLEATPRLRISGKPTAVLLNSTNKSRLLLGAPIGSRPARATRTWRQRPMARGGGRRGAERGGRGGGRGDGIVGGNGVATCERTRSDVGEERRGERGEGHTGL